MVKPKLVQVWAEWGVMPDPFYHAITRIMVKGWAGELTQAEVFAQLELVYQRHREFRSRIYRRKVQSVCGLIVAVVLCVLLWSGM